MRLEIRFYLSEIIHVALLFDFLKLSDHTIMMEKGILEPVVDAVVEAVVDAAALAIGTAVQGVLLGVGQTLGKF